MQKKQSESHVKVTVWLPTALVEAVKQMAAANERSFKGELVFELRTYHRGRRSRRAADPGRTGAAEATPETTLTPAPDADSSERGGATDLATDLASDLASDLATSWPEDQSAWSSKRP